MSDETKCDNKTEMEKWKEEALTSQEEFYDRLGDRDWDYIKSDERWALESKIGFALFGGPTEESEIDNNNGYTKENAKQIKSMCDLIYKVRNSKEVYIAFLFVIGKGDGEFVCPAFRVMTLSETSVFVDHSGRVYKDWEDFKNNNKYPKSELCYPKDGIYQADEEDKVLVTFAQSPACSVGSQVLNVADGAASVVTVAAIGVGIASFFVPILAPIALASTVGTTTSGLYGIGRGAYQIHDRRIHSQSISLADRDARNCWLSVFGSVFGVGSGLAMKGMVALVAKGKEIGNLGKIVVNILNFGSLTVNGFGVANGLANLIEKKMNGTLTKLDVLQFTTSALFFTNAAMNAKTANSIIEQVQTETISNFKSDLSKRRTKAFDKLVRSSGGDKTMQDKARIIKGISNVGSKDEFFRMTLRAQKQSSSSSLDNKGNLEVNGKSYVDTNIELQTHVKNSSSNSNVTPIVPTVKGENKFISTLNIRAEIYRIFTRLKKEYVNLSNDVKLDLTKNLVDKLAKLFEEYFYSKGNEPFSSETVSDAIILSEKFAKEKGCETEEDFIDFVRFLMIYVMSCMKDMENRYQKAKREMKTMMEDDFDESSFDRKWGIQDSKDRKGSFLEIVNGNIKKSNEDLKRKFDTYNQEVTALNQDGGLKFRTNYIALNEFYHSFVIDGRELSPIDFFEVIRQMANDDNCMFKYEEFFKGKCITYSDRDKSMFVKVFEIEGSKFFESVSVLYKSEL